VHRLFPLALSFYLVSTALGLCLRIFLVAPFPGLNFQHVMHAHSHTLYFGWAALGIFAWVGRRWGAFPGPWLPGAMVAISLATLVTFLIGGYFPPSIAVSALSIPLWAAAAVVVLRRIRGERGLAFSYLRVGMVYLLMALAGALGRVGVLAARVEDRLWGRLAVFAFLVCFAWFFVFSLLGLLVDQSRALGLAPDHGLLRWHLTGTAPIAWMTFPLGVAGGSAGLLGSVARVAAVAMLVPGLVGAVALWRGGQGARGAWLRWIAGWMALTAALEAAGALGMAELAVASRHWAVLYLHVLLVGVVTSLLLLLLAPGVTGRRGRWLHHGGMAVMAVGLGLAGLPVVAPVDPLVPRLGLILSLVGGVGPFVAGGGALLRLLRLQPREEGGGEAALVQRG
jgi:hypothetical protein